MNSLFLVFAMLLSYQVEYKYTGDYRAYEGTFDEAIKARNFNSMPQVYFHGGEFGQTAKIDKPTVLIGHSAGAHAALTLALNCDQVKKCKLISGVFVVGPIARMVGKGYFCGVSRYEASPLFHIPCANPNSPEFEIYYATFDIPGLRHQAFRLYNELRCKGYKVTICRVYATHSSIPCKLGYGSYNCP